jgi:hypothetical protein
MVCSSFGTGFSTKELAKMATQNQFENINKEVREMSREQGEERFASVNHVEVISYYERGAILYHASRVWFRDHVPGYQNWVLNALRIPLDLASRQQRVYVAILHSELTSDDFQGIPLSSVLLMVPILRRAKEVKKYREALPELLEVARTSSVAEVKARVYELRGMNVPSDEEKETGKTLRFNPTNFDKTRDTLLTMGREFERLGMTCVLFVKHATDAGQVAGYLSPEWREVFENECMPLLGFPVAPQREDPEVEVTAVIDETAQNTLFDDLEAQAGTA